MAAAGIDSVYLPLLVDNLPSFLDTYSSPDYGGFSVTIPHKVQLPTPPVVTLILQLA